MTPTRHPKSLSHHRWFRAQKRLERRLAAAEKVRYYTSSDAEYDRLRIEAWADYLSAVPELGELKDLLRLAQAEAKEKLERMFREVQ